MRIRNNMLTFVFLLMNFQVLSADSSQIMVEDFESTAIPKSVWVVNIPNENASVEYSTDQFHQGRQSLKLNYQFVSEGNFQYLGVTNNVNIQFRAETLRFWVKGDNSGCSYGVRLTDAGEETHQYSKNTGQGGLLDFDDWKEVRVNLNAGHETWGGDENHKIDYPIKSIIFTIGQPQSDGKLVPVQSQLYFDSITVDLAKGPNEALTGQINVLKPAYGSDIKGDTPIVLLAPGFDKVQAKCWRQGGKFGKESPISTVTLDADGNGSFLFPAQKYPHGPVTITISAEKGDIKDNCYLQLYNKGGVSWNEGLPKAPPAAKGMLLVFADDFDGPLSISSTDSNATYYDHKPPNGWQDFSTLRFTGFDQLNNPFSQMDTYLRIRASEKLQSSGLISSVKNDATGITAKAPCYFECRFIGPNATGTWPAFWIMTNYMTDYVKGIKDAPSDELDIIEAYGGEGPKRPNAFDRYMICPHAWQQGEEGKAIEKKAYDNMHNPIRMSKFGIPSTWYESFHIYGCKVTETETIYYCDNIEVGRHATMPLSKDQPFFFMINLATGGGWPVDLSRYNGQADMYVDYVRVYSGKSHQK